MLNGIHLVDYGNHRDTRVTFGRMTALVGQNGAGKTNLLRGIAEVNRKAFGAEDETKHGDSDKMRKGATEWLISASWPGSLASMAGDEAGGGWAVRIGSQQRRVWIWRGGPQATRGWVPTPTGRWEDIPTWDNMHDIYGIDVVPEKRPDFEKSVRPLLGRLDSTWLSSYFKTAGSYLQGPSCSESLSPNLSEDCRDLAWVVAYLKGDKDNVFAEITNALRNVVPAFRQVRHRPVPIKRLEKKEVVINKQPRLYDEEQKVMGQELRFDMASGSDLPASAISEGTLVSLAVLTAVMQSGDELSKEDTITILLDDLESGLHPSAQRDLVRQLRRLQETRPELQIIFSSHSPYIIDEMQPEEVWLFAADKEGVSHCAKLSDHPDAKRALGVLTTGEFWSAEGESWVLDHTRQTGEEAPAAAK